MSEDDVDQVVRTMSRAFGGDPFFSWLVPESVVPDGFAKFHRTALVHSFLPRCVCQTTPDVVAAAFWRPPAVEPPGDDARAALDSGFREAFGARYDVAMEAFETLHGHARPEPCWYLIQTGTHPDWRGRGIGARLLTAQLQEIDRAQEHAYLEVSNPRTVAFYERLGFRVYEEVAMPDGGPMVPIMYRAAAADGV